MHKSAQPQFTALSWPWPATKPAEAARASSPLMGLGKALIPGLGPNVKSRQESQLLSVGTLTPEDPSIQLQIILLHKSTTYTYTP